jgi:hypothetical protein
MIEECEHESVARERSDSIMYFRVIEFPNGKHFIAGVPLHVL